MALHGRPRVDAALAALNDAYQQRLAFTRMLDVLSAGHAVSHAMLELDRLEIQRARATVEALAAYGEVPACGTGSAPDRAARLQPDGSDVSDGGSGRFGISGAAWEYGWFSSAIYQRVRFAAGGGQFTDWPERFERPLLDFAARVLAAAQTTVVTNDLFRCESYATMAHLHARFTAGRFVTSPLLSVSLLPAKALHYSRYLFAHQRPIRAFMRFSGSAGHRGVLATPDGPHEQSRHEVVLAPDVAYEVVDVRQASDQLYRVDLRAPRPPRALPRVTLPILTPPDDCP